MSSIYHEDILAANVSLHSKLAESYDTDEPHFRDENIDYVRKILKTLVDDTRAERLLDLGCGTGFILRIAWFLLNHLDGVDATPAMMAKVPQPPPGVKLNLYHSDTGVFEPNKNTYDIVTAYSFLHHLFDMKPTLNTAYAALRPGGKFYIDLEPNYYFWDAIKSINHSTDLDPIVLREMKMLKDGAIQFPEALGVTDTIFNRAEYGKNILGGIAEDKFTSLLASVGFKDIIVLYRWFIGEGQLINEPSRPKVDNLAIAANVEATLQKALPLSRSLFKYVGFIATK